MKARTRLHRLMLVTLRSGRAARSVVLLGATCALMLALGAVSASAVTLTPTPDPLVGSTFQGGDGNQTAEGSTNLGPNTDWQNVAGSVVTSNDLPDPTDSCFVGGTKQLDPEDWAYTSCGTGVSPSKDNIFGGWSSTEGSSGDTFLYLAFQREAQTGDTYLAFELNQRRGTYTNHLGTVVPCRTDGDLLVSYQVASGGSPPNVDVVVHEWHTTTADPATGCAQTGTVTELDPQPYAEAAVNATDITNFLDTGTFGTTFPEGTFGEAALNLSGFFREQIGSNPCFNFGQVSMESHSSTSFTSDLKDVVGPVPVPIGNCEINVKKTVKLDGSTDDYAKTAEGPIGSTFDYQFDVSVPAGSQSLGVSSISDVLGTDASGNPFCTPVFQSGDSNSNGLVDPGEHWIYTCQYTSQSGDPANSPLENTVFVEGRVPNCPGDLSACGASANDNASITVDKAKPSISTTASNPNADHAATVGTDSISDTATVSGGDSPSGTVDFVVYKVDPQNPVCDQSTQVDSESGIALSGGQATATFDKPSSPGTYYWIATYNGDDNNSTAAGSCGDAGETSIVQKASPSVTTQVSDNGRIGLGHSVTDTATVSGGDNPGGSVTFKVYGPVAAGASGPCTDPSEGTQGNLVATLGSTANDDGTWTSDPFTAAQAGRYLFVATYNGDDNNNAASGKCGDANESVDVVTVAVNVKKSADEDHAYDGDKIKFTITATNVGSDSLSDVALVDHIVGTSHTCESVSGPTGDDGNGTLDPGETWTYVCTVTVVHSEENQQHQIVNTAHITGTTVTGGDHVTSNDSTADVPIYHPAIAIDKTGPATGTAGDKIGYVLTVTNPGDIGFAESTVQVTDAQCNGDPVTLIGKGGDTTPGSLDPGDVWTYSCSVQTQIGQTAVDNSATVGGKDKFGKAVQASDTAHTDLTQPGQLVLPERVTPGAAHLFGPTGCTARAFSARVRGSKIATVVFFLDGKKVKTLRKPDKKGLFQLRVNPTRLKVGVHRLVVNVTFQSGSGTRPKTIRLSFQRCGKKLAAPRFTG